MKLSKRKFIAGLVLTAMMGTFVRIPVSYAANNDYVGDLRWDFTNDMEGWSVNASGQNMAIGEIVDGVVKLTANNKTPGHAGIGYKTTINTSQYKYMRIRGKDTTNSVEGVLYMWNGSPVGQKYTKPAVGDKDFVEYVIELNPSSIASAITQMRFDPMSSRNATGVDYYLDSIVLSKHREEQDTEVVTSVSAGDVVIHGFDPTSEFCESSIRGNIYENLSEDDFEIELASDYEGATTSVKIKETTGGKYVDINVNYEGISRSYRIFLTSQKMYTGDIRFDFAADSEGFAGGRIEDGIAFVEDGELFVNSNLDAEAQDYKYLRLGLKNNGENPVDITLSGSGGELTYTLAADENYNEYVLALDSFDGSATGVIDTMILSSDGAFELDYAVLSKLQSGIASGMVDSLSLSGADIDVSKEYQQIELSIDEYESLNEDDIQISFKSGYENAFYMINVNEIGNISAGTDKKYVDITVFNSGMDEIDGYRICCNIAEDSVSKTYPGDIRFDFTKDSEGFSVKGTNPSYPEKGILRATINNDKDPNIMKEGLDIDLSQYKYIRMRIKNNTPGTMMQVYLFQATGPVTENMISKSYQISASDSRYKEYILPIAEFAEAGRRLDSYGKLRFDYANDTTGSVDIDYIVISKYEEAPTMEMVSGISIGGKEIVEFNGSDYCETTVYDDVYSDLSGEDIELTMGSGYESADVDVSIKSILNAKVIDIVANKGRYNRTYRIVCEEVEKSVGITITRCTMTGYSIEFAGNVANIDGNPVVRPITIIVHEQGSSVNVGTMEYVGVVMPDQNGNFEGTITIYDEENIARECNMEVLFDVSGEDMAEIAVVKYLNQTKMNEYVTICKEDTESGIVAHMAENEEIFGAIGIWLDLYNAQSNKTGINKATECHRNELNKDNAAEIINGDMLCVLLSDMSSSEVKLWIEKYDKNVKKLSVNGKSYSELTDKEKIWIAEQIIDDVPDGGYEALQKEVRAAMLLSAVNNAPYTDLKSILLTNTDILENSLTNLSGETNDKIVKEAMRILVLSADKTAFTEISNLVTAVDDALEEAEKKINKESDNSGSGSSGGGGSSGGKKYYAGTAVDTGNIVQCTVFDDLVNYPWAEEAILALNKMSIVHGVGDKLYAPANQVKREEFVKIICEAFNIPVGISNTKFADVDSSAWYAKYVYGAVESGVVFGKPGNLFGIGENITREDMCVMICRALALKGIQLTVGESNFTDADTVSEYAREAVAKLSSNGIVYGVGNNSFAPKNNSSRAEAAVIIYRCIKEFAVR